MDIKVEEHFYDDIIGLPHHQSETRPHMSLYDRAAQFSPFAALTGYEDAITETGRLTDRKIELGEYERERLDGRINLIQSVIAEQPEVTVTYFVPDEKKSGGEYVTIAGRVKRLDEYEHVVIMTDGTKIPLDDIAEIEGGIFASLEDM